MKKNNKTFIPLIIISLVAIFYVIYIGASLIIPFVIALIISFTIISFSNFFHKRGLNKSISFFLSLTIFFIFFWLIGQLINSNIQQIANNSEIYQQKFSRIAKSIENEINLKERFNILNSSKKEDSKEIQAKPFGENIEPKNTAIGKIINYDEILKKLDIPLIVSYLATGITSIFTNMGIIFFYTIFILLESRFFYKKIDLMFSSEGKDKVLDVISLIQKDIKAYFLIKTIIGLVTAVFSFIILAIFGVELALFWSFLIFILNYIPNIGSIISVLFPVLYSLIQFESFYTSFAIFCFLTLIQIVTGNIMEPRFMGNKLNLSPLVILISLIFWGTLWGVIGMLLSVPIMVIINIVLSHIKSTRPIAILLSEQGIIKTDFLDMEKKRQIVEKIKKKIFKNKK